MNQKTNKKSDDSVTGKATPAQIAQQKAMQEQLSRMYCGSGGCSDSPADASGI